MENRNDENGLESNVSIKLLLYYIRISNIAYLDDAVEVARVVLAWSSAGPEHLGRQVARELHPERFEHVAAHVRLEVAHRDPTIFLFS